MYCSILLEYKKKKKKKNIKTRPKVLDIEKVLIPYTEKDLQIR